MAVKIRLARHGRKKRAIYDIVVADARAPRDGKFIEKLGQYNPNVTPAGLVLDNERALHWLMVGALPTDTTRKILSVEGLMYQKHLQVGVVKGAISQEDADKKHTAWVETKTKSREERIANLVSGKADIKKAALAAETKKKEGILAKRAEAEQALIAAAEAEEAAKIAAAAPKVEAVVEETVEAPAATEEAPATEAPEADKE
ncbi:30S ribosomal protein S16 [Arcticibacterium luteifluviistationis]|uniref:Small ribosomal subunit protein bS16 n=1 Tax=Arcticibacterium luteifluviistationis TaxID=1784714 RepID=A0A2Z4G6T1_9BACT|nr:30S ribosomal protein S16 [Arcticibacterium luteifluviistationis]AWV96859.1 30S ribosomal protein S16 [Arcticibacterium luteifluviistationis]